MTVCVELLDAACKQVCAKGDKDGVKLFVERNLDKTRWHEICRNMLDALFGYIAVDASEGSVAVFACAEDSGNGRERADLTGLDVGDQSVLLQVPGETCRTDVVHVLYAAVPREEAARADGSRITVEEREILLAGEALLKICEMEIICLPIIGAPSFLVRRWIGGPSFLVRRWIGAFSAKPASYLRSYQRSGLRPQNRIRR